MRYNDGLAADQYGKLIECIVCKNTEFLSNGLYCRICGESRVNICSNPDCGSQNSSNARFCEYCGEETLFFRKKLLKPWNEVDDSVKVEDTESSEDDDVLPF